jgi:hypothetical protein
MDESRLALAHDPAYWKKLCPHLSIDGSGKLPRRKAVEERRPHKDVAGRMREEGWAPYGEVLAAPARDVVKDAMDRVREAGWLPVYAFLYDQLWLAGRTPALLDTVESVLGPGFRQIPDFWAYRIAVANNSHGYRPHREVNSPLLRPDGSPLSVTVWLPLNDATLDNGCMYVLPKHLDIKPPFTPEQEALYRANGLHNAIAHRARALPTPAGHALSWNHNLYHWGGFSSSRATHPRMSLAFEFLCGNINPAIHEHTRFDEENAWRPPLTFDPRGDLPNFRQRLFLVGRQVNRYYEILDDGVKAFSARLTRDGYPRAMWKGRLLPASGSQG